MASRSTSARLEVDQVLERALEVGQALDVDGRALDGLEVDQALEVGQALDVGLECTRRRSARAARLPTWAAPGRRPALEPVWHAPNGTSADATAPRAGQVARGAARERAQRSA